ncbi:protein kinase domain protein [Ichthyophthirius multifiliis]|uniref:Protein kinase domain protein n=1 Tax=Ichthyophthirius multifiliis TaxID=5932 RepID=G0QMC9_ICHMU|nr:protein kinase domain protein [Ichthyophthirius multifiliis]EGR33623.1 protein kinase domain protein [Ichthyophthirius multifiliis]|eukprot:XP_004037609.1 protein kinase domain protein [Ichthyophthirius multifiliis]
MQKKIFLKFWNKNLLVQMYTQKKKFKNQKKIKPEIIRCIIYQLLKALNQCHKQDVIHRDVKPENLLVNPYNYELKLCDFGFARQLPSKQTELLTDYVATRWYRAPELLLQYQKYGKEVDVWAIACIMGELIDGQPMFPGENEIDQLYLIQKMLGPLTVEQKELFIKNPRFLGMKFPEINKPETLERRYLGKLSKKALNIMKGMLKMDPQERITIEEAMKHPYFDEIRDQYKNENEEPKNIYEELKKDNSIKKQIDKKNFINNKVIQDEKNSNNNENLQEKQQENNNNFIKTEANTNEKQNRLFGQKSIPSYLQQGQKIMQNTVYNYKMNDGSFIEQIKKNNVFFLINNKINIIIYIIQKGRIKSKLGQKQ